MIVALLCVANRIAVIRLRKRLSEVEKDTREMRPKVTAVYDVERMRTAFRSSGPQTSVPVTADGES